MKFTYGRCIVNQNPAVYRPGQHVMSIYTVHAGSATLWLVIHASFLAFGHAINVVPMPGSCYLDVR